MEPGCSSGTAKNKSEVVSPFKTNGYNQHEGETHNSKIIQAGCVPALPASDFVIAKNNRIQGKRLEP
jgi:hypothetical protein